MKHKLAIVLSGVCIGLIGVLVKLIGGTIPAMTLNFMRMLIGLITIAVIIPFIDKDFLKVNKKELIEYATVGFIMALAFSMFVIATLLAPISNVVLINSTYVIFTAVLTFFILKENITAYHIIAILVAIGGMFILNPFALGKALGNYIAMAHAFVFGALVVYMRKVEKKLHLKSVFWFFLFATIFLLPFGIYYGFAHVSSVMIYLIPLGVIATGIAYFLFAYGIQKTGAEDAAILSLATFPIFSIIFAVLIINEPIDLTIIVGGALLLIGGIIATKKCGLKKAFLCV